jgi:hypothetical protein
MGWTWRYTDAHGSTISTSTDGSGADLPAPSFPTQADAESWIGETWAELLAAGVDAVFLMDDQAQVYGPMSLRTAQ